MDLLAVEGVSFSYVPGVPVLRNISLTVRTGEFLSLAGPNGSGKTTLLRLLDRIYVPQSGSILLSGAKLEDLPRSALARRMAFVPQNNAPLFPFTVSEIVLMGRSPHMRGKLFENDRDREIARSVMALADVLHLADQPITALSGGERQRAFIARALAQQPEIILLDEPNAHLDIAHQIDIFRLIRKLNAESGLTVISVSHDLNLAASYSDRIAMMVNGSLAAVGAPETVITESQVREVFRTDVLVDRHPANQTPRVTLLT